MDKKLKNTFNDPSDQSLAKIRTEEDQFLRLIEHALRRRAQADTGYDWNRKDIKEALEKLGLEEDEETSSEVMKNIQMFEELYDKTLSEIDAIQNRMQDSQAEIERQKELTRKILTRLRVA